MKFFGVLRLTCDSIKLTPGSEARKQVTMMLPVALLPHSPLQIRGLTQPMSLLSLPLHSGNICVVFHNVNLHNLGYASNAPPKG